MAHIELLLIAGIIGLGVICQWISWRLKFPAIVPLLAAGFLIGPVLNILHPQELLGDLFFPTVSLSVGIILFEGALTLKWKEVRNVAAAVRNLITIGALITWIGGAVVAHFLLGFDWELALLFGSLVVVTGPTVIGPLLRNVRPIQSVSSVLKWEGVLIDPIGALLAVLIFDFIVAEGASRSLGIHAIVGFLRIVLIGTTMGVAGGYFAAFLLKRYLIPDYLREIGILAIVAAVFAVSDLFQSESGLLSVTVMGILLANMGLSQVHQIWHFKERLSILLISTLFIVLAANISLADIALLDWRALVILAVLMFILRPLSVHVSTLRSPLDTNERLFLSWIAPRGIVAASVSSLFALRLVELGYTQARLLAPLVFLVIVGTVVLQGGTANFVARRLGVAEAEPQGYLIVGAQRLGRTLGLALKEAGFTVRLVDMNRENVRQARLAGLDVYRGNILSEFTENDIDLSGIGHLLALTSNDEANAIACLHLQDELSSSNVYQLPPHALGREQRSPSAHRMGRVLFDEDATYERLIELLRDGAGGASIKTTTLTEQFTYEHYREQYDDNFLPLLAFKEADREVRINTVEQPFEPEPGWTVMSLVWSERRHEVRDKVEMNKPSESLYPSRT